MNETNLQLHQNGHDNETIEIIDRLLKTASRTYAVSYNATELVRSIPVPTNPQHYASQRTSKYHILVQYAKSFAYTAYRLPSGEP